MSPPPWHLTTYVDKLLTTTKNGSSESFQVVIQSLRKSKPYGQMHESQGRGERFSYFFNFIVGPKVVSLMMEQYG